MIVTTVKPETFTPIQITLTDREEVRLLYNIVRVIALSASWLQDSQMFAQALRDKLEKAIDK